MTVQGTNTVENNLQKVVEELEAARKMQDDWINHGVDFVDLYVEDAGGDWLEKWGKCEEELEQIIKKVDVEAVKAAIGICDFGQTELLETALSSRGDRPQDSGAGEEVKYKRLSLLGGAIFGAVVTDYLYREYPELDCDAISTLKARLADNQKLSEFAKNLKLNELIRRVGSQKATDKNEENKNLAQTFEALSGAIYLEFERDFFRAGKWLIQQSIERAILFEGYANGEHLDLTQQSKSTLLNELKRREILGADILEAIAIDYLYNRFPESNSSQLTRWKNMLAVKEIFPKDFKAKLGSHYLELEGNFSRTRDWLVDNFIKTAVDELEEESGDRLN
ncbi:ribonuclease III domain-containing protein [Microcoleus sp. herbarium19]|uniref:ribonuclease III domain-containing protein n=1 Tax=unclassified Microcoleus TaxID=2642155 RepID=UPI002FD361B2